MAERLALSIFIPLDDDVVTTRSSPSSSPNAEVSPVVLRLKAHGQARSPEAMRDKEDLAASRAKLHLESVAAKARAHNQGASERVRRKLFLEDDRREALRQKVEVNLAAAEKRRRESQDSRTWLSRSREAKENEVKAALARKSHERAERARREAERCTEAERLRKERIQNVVAQAQQLSGRVSAPASPLMEAAPKLESAPRLVLGVPLVPPVDAPPEAQATEVAVTTTTPAPKTEAELATDVATADDGGGEVKALSAALLREIDGHRRAKSSWEELTAWMQADHTLALVDSWLRATGATEAGRPKLLLALVAMQIHSSDVFDEEAAHDATMKRETRRFVRQLRLTLGAAVPAANPTEAFRDSLARARRFPAAWSTLDKPRTVEFLMGSLVAMRAREHEERVAGTRAQAASGAARTHDASLAPPLDAETIFAHLRRLGGAPTEAEGRARFAGEWQAVSAASLEAQVTEIAQRAFWDAVRDALARGSYEPLWGVLRELQQAMRALAAASTLAVEDLDDKFDVGWLEQRVAHGALEADEVRQLIRYLCDVIASWQAPVDDADTRTWRARVDEGLRATARASLDELIGSQLIDFVRGAIERVGKVYQRLLALGEEMHAARQAEPRASAAEAQD